MLKPTAPAPKPVVTPIAPAHIEGALAVPPPPPAKPEPIIVQRPTPVVVREEPPAAPAPLKRITIPYEAWEGTARRILIPVTLNGSVTVKMALDTGAHSTIISYAVAERLGALREGDGVLATAAAGIGGRTSALLIVLDSLSVGEARTEFVPATVTRPISDGFAGLVGMDFIAGYAVEIDTQQHLLILTEQPTGPEMPGGHDQTWWRLTYKQFGGQPAAWKTVRAQLEDRSATSDISNGCSA